MLESKTEEEWSSAYMVRPNSVFVSDQTKLSYWIEFMKVQSIILDTSCLTRSRKSQHERGDQNRSSIAAYLGDGADWTILENIAQLLRRHKDVV
jgi:hypothetical protein